MSGSSRSSSTRCCAASRSRSTGADKTLDFTYVDDCVDGIARGIEALAERRVVNQTINLAYGEGNTLVHCAERIAHELGTEPDMTLAPSLLGEVTHYVADLSKARALLDYDPKVPLDDGIARAVAWFREHREAIRRRTRSSARTTSGAQERGQGWKTAPVARHPLAEGVRRRTGASCARRGAAARPAGPRAGSRRTCPDRDARRGAGARSSEDGSRCPRR